MSKNFFESFFINFYLIIFSIFCFQIPKVSIIININKANNFLEQFLDNLIIKQSLKQKEIILINYQFIEKNYEILKKYMFNNKIIIVNKLNIDDENDALGFANGKYFGIIEINDFIDNNMFENLYEFSINKDINIVSYNYYLFWEKKKE